MVAGVLQIHSISLPRRFVVNRCKTLSLAAIAFASVCAIAATSADAANVYYVNSLTGSQPGFGHDPDKGPPQVTADGFHAAGATGDYRSFRFAPSAIGLSGLTLGDISSIAYSHKQAGGGLDWQFKVYTEAQPSSSTGAWYGVRLNYPISIADSSGAATTFTSTNSTAERIKVFGQPDIYRNSNASGFNSALSASGSQKVLFFDVSAGANSGGWNFNTFLQDVTVSTIGGVTATATAVVPAPAAIFGGTALFGMLGFRRKRA
jgi:type IV secretory pathway VirB2 component (pilin)